jgi:hypothetical protein
LEWSCRLAQYFLHTDVLLLSHTDWLCIAELDSKLILAPGIASLNTQPSFILIDTSPPRQSRHIQRISVFSYKATGNQNLPTKIDRWDYECHKHTDSRYMLGSKEISFQYVTE